MTFYSGKTVVVTGGLGFIGSNIALRLAKANARVIVIDPCVPGCGGNPRNLDGAATRIEVVPCDMGSPELPVWILERAEAVFNLAGEVSHMASMADPERDLNINTLAQLRFLRRLAEARPGIRIVYGSTRQVYGVPEYLPVDENHPVSPVDFNGIHKHAATSYHLMLSRAGSLDACILRLTNVYGPRLSLDVPGQGVLAAFLRKLSRGERLEVFGDGRQLRDPVYIDDVVEAFLLAGAVPRLPSRTYNVAGPAALDLNRIAEDASLLAGVEPPTHREFSAQLKPIDIGSYVADTARIRREIGWQPTTSFADGFAKTLAHYRLLLAAHA